MRRSKRAKKSYLLFFLLLLSGSGTVVFAQERLGLSTENYAGISNIFVNPANSAHTPFQFDLNFGNASFFLNNRIISIDTDPINGNGNFAKLSLSPFDYGSGDVKAFFKFPSLALRFENFSVGIFSNLRFQASGINFPNEFARRLRKGYDPSFAGTTYEMKRHAFASLNWRESGFNISRTIKYYKHERLYLGINLKALYQGNGFYYGSTAPANITLLDSIHYFVDNYDGLLGRGQKGYGASGDIGIKFVKFERGPAFTKEQNEDEKLYNNYLFSAGLSIVDLGGMKFKQNASTTPFSVNNLGVEIDTSVLNNQSYPDPTALLIGSLGNMYSYINNAANTEQKFSMKLPTSIMYQGDYQPWRHLYVNLSGRIPLRMTKGAQLPAAGIVSLTPRFESKKFMVALPMSLYRYREPTIGLAARYRGLTVGSDVLFTGNRTQGFDHLDMYFSFKISIEEMEHTFIKPPVPPPIHLIPDTVALPEWGYMNKFAFKQTETGQIFYSKNKMSADTVYVTDLDGKPAYKMLAGIRPQYKKWYKPWKYGFGFHITTVCKMRELGTGIYVFDKKIPFIVKPAETKEILVVIPTNEFTANNMAGGRSLHQGVKNKKPGNIVSFMRPTDIRDFEELTELVKFFKADTSLHVGYICEKDLENSTIIKDAKVLIIAGNSAHWTRRARQNFDKYLDKGGNAIVVSKDFMHWQVRYRQKGTQMICHKKRLFDFVQDPYLKSTTWDDPKLKYARPARIEQDESDATVISSNGNDSLLLASMNNKVVKTLIVNKSNADKLKVKIESFNEKNNSTQLLFFGETENKTTPVLITRKKATSGHFIQLSNLDFLKPLTENQKKAWYGLLKYTGAH